MIASSVFYCHMGHNNDCHMGHNDDSHMGHDGCHIDHDDRHMDHNDDCHMGYGDDCHIGHTWVIMVDHHHMEEESDRSYF